MIFRLSLCLWETTDFSCGNPACALYEFDLATFLPIRSVLTGVDGQTFGEDNFYSESSWLLAENRLLTSDCKYDSGFKQRARTFRLWDASSLMGPKSSPDPARPYTRQLLSNYG